MVLTVLFCSAAERGDGGNPGAGRLEELLALCGLCTHRNSADPKRRCVMSKAIRVGRMAWWGIAVLLATDVVCFAQGPTDNPYRPVRGLADGGGPSIPGGEWARLPGGREMGPPASVHVDVDGESI